MQQQQKVKKMEENLTILRRCSLFAGLSDTQTAALLQSLHPVRRSFSKGEVLLLAGYETQELGVVLCGPIEAGFTLREIDVDGKPFRGALVEHLRTGVRTCYEVDEQTTYWTLWNNGGQVPYCCPEPQTWTTNAPNAADPAAEGFRAIDPGESWRTTFRLYAK